MSNYSAKMSANRSFVAESSEEEFDPVSQENYLRGMMSSSEESQEYVGATPNVSSVNMEN